MQDTQTFNFSEYWHFFLRLLQTRRWTILTFLTVTFLVVAIGTAFQTRMYDASVTVLIDMEPPNVLTVSTTRDDSTMGQINYLTYADYYRTQLEVIRGRRIAKKVFENLKLGENPQYARQRDPVGALQGQLTVKPIKQTRLVTLTVETPNPKQSAQIANEFAFVFVSDNLAKAAANEAVTLMKNEYLKLQSKEAELSKRYKAKFPAMMRLREQMNQLATSIEKELARQLSDEQSSDNLPEPEPRKEEPPVQVGTGQKAAGVLFHRLQENSMMGGLRPNNIRIQDLAQVPLKKTKPKVTLNLLLAIVLGLMGGIAAAAIEEFLDNTLKVPKDIERDGRFTLLGHIPKIVIPGEPGKPPAPHDPGLLCRHMHLKTNSEAAEGYRVIRTSLIYATPGNDTRTFLFTSPGSGDGKTTTASNLAIALSQLGLKVLLVDADLRNPSIHAGFGIPQSPGLSEFLMGRNSFQEVIHRAGILDLCIAPSGACPPNPAELLSLPQMRDFLKQAEHTFDRVILDTPPIVPVTDATLLAAFTKSVVAVTLSGKTPWQALERLNTNCKAVHAKVLGVILNNVTSFDVPVYGYGRQNYPYGKPSSRDQWENFPSAFLRRAQKALQTLKSRIAERKFFHGNSK